MTTLWTDPGHCGQCAHCGMDMDMDPFCVQKDTLALRTAITGRDYPWGLDLTPAWFLCQGAFFQQHPKRDKGKAPRIDT